MLPDKGKVAFSEFPFTVLSQLLDMVQLLFMLTVFSKGELSF